MRIEPFGDQIVIQVEKKKAELQERVLESADVPFPEWSPSDAPLRMLRSSASELCCGVIEAMPTVPQAFEDRGESAPFNDRIDGLVTPLMQSLLSSMKSLMNGIGLNQAIPVSDLSVGDRVLFHGGIELDVVDEPCLLLVRSSAVVARLHSEEDEGL